MQQYKKKLVGTIASEKNRIIRVLEDANVKLSSVVSDTSGVTATYLINGLIQGRKDLESLVAECYLKQLQATPGQIKEAINGRLTPHHAFILKYMQKQIASVEEQIVEIDAEIEKYIKDFEEEIALLQTIPGVAKEGAIGIVSEIGVDMDVFPSEHHLESHSGMCPGNNESAGKKKFKNTTGEQTFKSNAYQTGNGEPLAQKEVITRPNTKVWCQDVARNGHFYQIGHKILCAAYHIIKKKEPFKELGYEYLAEREKKNRLEYLRKELKEHGYKIKKAA